MGAYTTPDGQTIYVPDGMFGTPPPADDATAPAIGGAGPPPMDASVAGGPSAAPTTAAPPPQSVVDQMPPEVMQRVGLTPPSGPLPPSVPAPPPPTEYQAQLPPGVDTSPAGLAKSNATFTKQQQLGAQQQAQAQAAANTPEGMAAAAYKGELGANQQQKDIAAAGGALAGQEAKAGAVAEQEAFDQAQRARAQEKQDEAVRQAKIAEHSAAYDKAIAAEASAKIDDGRRWNNLGTGSKIFAGISVALSGIGDAMQHKSGPNLALGIIQDAIKQDVASQVRDKEDLGKRIGYAKNSLDSYREVAGDERQAAQLKIAEGYKVAAEKLRLAASKYAEPKAQLAAMSTAAQLDQQAAGITQNAGKAKFDLDKGRQELANQKQTVAIAGGHLSLARSQETEHIREYNLDRQDKLAEFAQKQTAAGNPKLAALAEKQSKEGIGNPRTGNAILQPEGEVQLSQAKQLEAQAKTAKTPAERDALLTHAKDLKDSAESLYGFRIADPEVKKEAFHRVTGAQMVVDAIADIKKTLGEKDPSSLDRDEWASIGAKWTAAKTAYLNMTGAPLNSRGMDAIEGMFDEDPRHMKTRLIGRGELQSSLDVAAQNAVSTTAAVLRGAGYRGNWKPDAPQAVEKVKLNDATSVSAGADAEPGAITKALTLPAVYHPLESLNKESPEVRAENSFQGGPTGLSKGDDSKLLALAHNYDGATDDQKGQIRDTLRDVAAGDDTAKANAVISRLKGENIKLFREVMAELPADKREELGGYEYAPKPKAKSAPVKVDLTGGR